MLECLNQPGVGWTTLWNNGGLGLLTPSFGGGRPPKLTEKQRERLLGLLADGEPWKKQEIQDLISQEFDVEFHPNHLPRLLDDLSLSDAISRPERSDRLENADEILDERVADAFAEDDRDEPRNKQPEDDSDNEWTLNDDVRTDGGTTVGFFDVSHPQPWDNSQRLYTVTEPTITSESVLQFPPNQNTEEICACFEEIREQNPFPPTRILLVLDNFSLYVCAHTRERTHELEVDLVFLPIGSLHLNSIEPIWRSPKRESSPLIMEGAVFNNLDVI